MPSDLAQLAYQCDAPEVTGYAGMPAFMKFAYGFGLADLLGDLPMPKRESIYAPGKLSEVVVAILAAGLERVSHIDDVKHDPGLCVALGLDRLQERPQRMVVDVDTREVGVYGKQEGSKRSPRRDGDRIYTFEVATLRNSYDILDGGLLEGATHPAPRFRERMRDILDQLCEATEELVWCADAAWYAAHILQEIEAADAEEAIACRCRYAIRAQIRDGLDQAIAAIPEGQWRPCDEELEIAELRYTFKQVRDHDGRKVKDERERRYVVTRKRLVDRAQEKGQGALLEAPRYEHQAIVTDLTWSPRRVWAFYNRRVTVESILKESALGFGMDHLPSSGFAGNGLFCQLLILAYNYVNVFRRLCLPRQGRRRYVQGLRRVLLAVPAWVERASEALTVHCSPRAQLLPAVLGMVSSWLAPAQLGGAQDGAGALSDAA
jgi:hypothetical protein